MKRFVLLTVLITVSHVHLAAQEIKPDSVTVTFNITIPESTPSGDQIFWTGTLNRWDPGSEGLGLSAMDLSRPALYTNNTWAVSLTGEPGDTVHYKYTRGSIFSKAEFQLDSDKTAEINLPITTSVTTLQEIQQLFSIMMRDFHAKFESGHFYHILNRGNNKENLFRDTENYSFFLKKWTQYLNEYVDVLSYCLMPNHFHFLIKIKPISYFQEIEENEDVPDINKYLENQFKRLFSSYTLSFNKYHNRTGSLFQKRFKRILIDSNQYLMMVIHYIHHNPIHHGFVGTYENWPYSSFAAITSSGSTKVKRKEVLDWFGGLDAFLDYHNKMVNYNSIDHLITE